MTVGLVSLWTLLSGCGSTAAPGTTGLATSQGSQRPVELLSERARAEQYVATLHSAADIRHTFVSEQGETIDCVDYYSQPSVKARLAVGASKQGLAPPSLGDLLLRSKDTAPAFAALAARILAAPPPALDANGNARQCPAGSVPSLRPRVEQILGAGGLDAYLGRAVHHPKSPQRSKVTNAPETEPPGYLHVIGQYNNRSINGGVTTTSIYGPTGNASFIHSLSQFWFTAGTNQSTCVEQCTSNCEQSIEVGWEVEPSVFTTSSGSPDYNPHLFVFTTPDGYWTDCMDDSICVTEQGAIASQPWQSLGGNWAPGQALTPSEPGTTPPSELEMGTIGYNGEWIVIAESVANANDYLMGEYPSTYYAGGPLANIATETNITANFWVGGEVEWNDAQTLVPVALAMGDGASGLLPVSPPYGIAAYHRNVGLFIYDEGLGELTPAFDNVYQGDDNCYDMQQTQPGGSGWENFFYFGGLGQICFGSDCNACCSSSDTLCTQLKAAETAAINNGCGN
jgi:Neprosin